MPHSPGILRHSFCYPYKIFEGGIAKLMPRNVYFLCLLGVEFKESLTEITLLTMGLKSLFPVGYQIEQQAY